MQPLHAGEIGPPYLYHGFALTKGYAPNAGSYWLVYTREQWDAVDGRAEFKTRRKKDAVAWIQERAPRLRRRLEDFRLETYTERQVLLSALTDFNAVSESEKKALVALRHRVIHTECQPGGCELCGGDDAQDD